MSSNLTTTLLLARRLDRQSDRLFSVPIREDTHQQLDVGKLKQLLERQARLLSSLLDADDPEARALIPSTASHSHRVPERKGMSHPEGPGVASATDNRLSAASAAR
jgi:hypothetical protein